MRDPEEYKRETERRRIHLETEKIRIKHIGIFPPTTVK